MFKLLKRTDLTTTQINYLESTGARKTIKYPTYYITSIDFDDYDPTVLEGARCTEYNETEIVNYLNANITKWEAIE